MSNRKKTTDEIVMWLEKMLPGSDAGKDTRALLDAMTDELFESYIDALENEDEYVSLAVPNLDDHKLEMENLLAVAGELGHDPWQHLKLTDPATGVVYLTPEKYLVIDLPLRRQQQSLSKKISIPDNNRHVDELTGQPAGDSKGASLSYPEVQVLRSQSLVNTIVELIKVRGGDEKAMRAANRSIIETGGVRLEPLMQLGTRVKSTENLGILLKGMHLDNDV